MNQTTKALLDRLQSIRYSPLPGKRWSHVALFKEHARRMSWWADTLGIEENWLVYDFATKIQPDLRLDDTAVEQLQSLLQSQQVIDPMADLLYAALRWSAITDSPDVKAYDLPEPYDAVLMLHMRGGFFRWNQRGFREVSAAFGVGGVDIPTYRMSKPFVELNEAELNLIDNEDEAIATD